MKKLIVSIFLASVGFSHAQTILNSKSPEEFRQLREENKMMKGDSIISKEVVPLSYGYIDEKDVLKSIVVWEIIDMNDKLNQQLYHNSDGLVTQNKSLFQILIDGINSGKISEVYDDEYFTTRLEPEEIKKRTSKLVISDDLIDKINSGAKVTEADRAAGTDVYETKSEDVKLLKIKGMWYIDKRDSQMKYRLLGIAAMGKDPQTMGVIGGDGELVDSGDDYIDLFWVYYPNVRPLLANYVVFNGKNLSSDITYDDVMNARRFSSIIYKSDNGLGNGVIKDYIPRDADAQLEESERIKAQILQMENDMWNY